MSTPPTYLNPPTTPVAPDADWVSVVDRLMTLLTQSVPEEWSDHNVSDPGITLAETAAYGVADLHYRTAERGFEAWPLEARAFEPEGDRHWQTTLPVGVVSAIADGLAAAATSASELEPRIRACREPSDAIALLTTAPWSTAWTSAERPVVISLMRARLVRALGHEYADLVSAAVAAEAGSADPVTVRDARAAHRLQADLSLWPGELAALVRRERRRLSQGALVDRLAQVRAAVTTAQAAACRSDLVEAGLDDTALGYPTEADIALAAARQPVNLVPEHLEALDGATQVWPPHPIQALTCEPVVAGDYARRAREHPRVGRAWAVPGRLGGVAWNGLPVAATTADPAAHAITLVVERTSGTSQPIGAFLREVLQAAVGTECGAPFPTWQDTFDPDDPRRVICDEVGASLLRTVPVVVQGVVVTGVGVDPDTTLLGVRRRVHDFFTGGRTPVVSEPPEEVSGPWPLHPQPSGGWVPGDPLRFTEVIAAMVAEPMVLGIEDLEMQIEGDTTFRGLGEGSLPIPPDAVPDLANYDCLSLRFALTGECGDA